MARTGAQWEARPNLPPTHYVDPRVYTDLSIFEEEREKILEKTWAIVCHESEVPDARDFRRCQHMSGKELLVVRGEDMKIRVFYNQCPHRGNVLAYEPSGNARRITCIFHLWSFDTKGNCVEITREKEGFQDRLSRKDVGLREVRSEMDMGGFVWVNVDDDCEPLDAFLGDSIEFLRGELTAAPLEIMCYHKAIVPTNYKLWHDTNRDLYHEFLHRQNRLIAMGQPGYLDRRYHLHVHGHVTADPSVNSYRNIEKDGGVERRMGWPGGEAALHKLCNLFPTVTYNMRPPALRIDTMVPLGPEETIVEFRGFGIKGDSPEERQERLRDYNSFWGPFGRNLPEDFIAIVGQSIGLNHGRGSPYILHGREEETPHSEVCIRHYFAEWSRMMGRTAADPFGELPAVAAE